MNGDEFHENQDLAADFHIVNWVRWPNKSTAGVDVGRIERWDSSEVKIAIDDSAIVWPTWFNQVGGKTTCFLLFSSIDLTRKSQAYLL